MPADLQLVLGTDSVRLLVPQLGSRLLAYLDSGGLRLRGTRTQPGLRPPLVLRHAPLPATSTVTSLSRPYREEKVLVSNFAARLRLVGSLAGPACAEPCPAVVLLSDLGAHNYDGRPTSPQASRARPLTHLLQPLPTQWIVLRGEPRPIVSPALLAVQVRN